MLVSFCLLVLLVVVVFVAVVVVSTSPTDVVVCKFVHCPSGNARIVASVDVVAVVVLIVVVLV